jgi:hypothetical protein
MKLKHMIHITSYCLLVTGIFLINDSRLVAGVFLMIWANNLDRIKDN